MLPNFIYGLLSNARSSAMNLSLDHFFLTITSLLCFIATLDLDKSFYLNADSEPDWIQGAEQNTDPCGAEPMRILADPNPDTDPGKTLRSQKVKF